MPNVPFTIISDTREPDETCWQFPEHVKVERRKIDAGDYGVREILWLRGIPGVVIERKTLDDLVSTLIYGADRFGDELALLRGCPLASIVVEATLDDILRGRYVSKATPQSVIGRLAAFARRTRIMVHFAGSRDAAEEWAYRWFKGAVDDAVFDARALGMQFPRRLKAVTEEIEGEE